MLIVLLGPITVMTVSIAISSALVEEGVSCVPALNWARVVLVVLYIIQPIPIVVDSQFCVSDPSVYISRLFSFWILCIISVSSFRISCVVDRYCFIALIVSDVVSRWMVG